MKPDCISAREMMERMKTDEWLSVIAIVESGDLPAHEKGAWEPVTAWGKTVEPIWKSSPFGNKTKPIQPENIRSIPMDLVVFFQEDVERFEAGNDSASLDNITKAQHQKLKKGHEKMKARLERAYDVGLELAFNVVDNFETHGGKIIKEDFIKMGKEKCPDLPKEIFKDLWKKVPDRYTKRNKTD